MLNKMRYETRFLKVLMMVMILFTTFSSSPVSAHDKIDARVLQDTGNGQTAHFLVYLNQQAHPGNAAAAARDRDQRGRIVFDALRNVAASTQPAVRAQLEALGLKYRAYWIANVFAVEGNRAAVEALAARPDVQAIESDDAFTVQLEQPTVQSPETTTTAGWDLTWINVPGVWALGDTGQNTVYANADTGVQWDHPALKTHYRGWNGTTADHNYNWWDAIHSDIDGNGNPCGFNLTVPCDDNGHGTHTMGTGVGDDGAGNQIGSASHPAPSGSAAGIWMQTSGVPARTLSACSSSWRPPI
jgi:serine protease AprX